jgi:hypothetical protein
MGEELGARSSRRKSAEDAEKYDINHIPRAVGEKKPDVSVRLCDGAGLDLTQGVSLKTVP